MPPNCFISPEISRDSPVLICYLSQVLNQLGQPKTATAQVQAAQKVALKLQNQDYLQLAKFEQTQIQQSQLTQKFNQLTLIDNIAEVNQKLNQFSAEATDIFSTYETLSQTPSLKSAAAALSSAISLPGPSI